MMPITDLGVIVPLRNNPRLVEPLAAMGALDRNLVDMRRARGTVVREIPDLARLYHLADRLLDEAARLGITREELTELLISRS